MSIDYSISSKVTSDSEAATRTQYHTVMKDFHTCKDIMAILFLLTYLLVVVTCTHDQLMRVISVQPDNLSEKCLTNSSLFCYTLTELINCNQHYNKPKNCSLQDLFTSNTATVFLPGVHTYDHSKSNNNSSAFLSISHIANIAFLAANADTGAIIRCDSDFAFVFQDVVNLSITDIKFENCGAYDPMDYIDQKVSVLIASSENVSILNLKVTNGKQVGLTLINVANITMSYLSLINNSVNIYILTKDVGGPYNYYNNQLSRFIPRLKFKMTLSHSFLINGISNERLILLQMHFDVVIQFTNITLENGGLYIFIDNPMHSTIEIGHLYANNTSDNIYIDKYWEIVFNNHDSRPMVTFSHSHFINYKHIIKKGEIRSRLKYAKSVEKTMISFSNVYIEKSSYPLEWTNIKVILENANIVNNYEKFQLILVGASLQIEGLFIFQENDAGIQLLPNKQTTIDSTLIIAKKSTVLFKDNIMTNQDIGSVLYARNTDLYIYNSTLTFSRNHGVVSGGITLINSSIFVYGESEITFLHNTGSTGGGIAFFEQSKLILLNKSTQVHFIENHAQKFGGALFVYDNDYIVRTGLFRVYYSDFFKSYNSSLASVTFSNNTAELSGTALYGGWIDALSFPASTFHNIQNSVKDFSLVFSDAIRICMCIHSIPRCESEFSHITISTIPGQTYTTQVVAVGQRFGTVVSTVHAQLTTISDQFEHTSELAQKEYVQELGTECTEISLTVMSLRKMEQLKLTPVNYNSYAVDILKIALNQSRMSDKLLFEQFEITFLLQECPWGFYLDNSLKQCSCAHALQTLGINCNSELYVVLRSTPKWVGASVYDHNKMGFVVHSHCPFDYCVASDIPMSLSLENLDDQCTLNRSGILCGMCSDNLSQVLGTSRCIELPQTMDSIDYPTDCHSWIISCGISDLPQPDCLCRHHQWTYILCQHCQSK